MTAGAVDTRAAWDGHAARYPAQEWLEARAISAALESADPGPEDRLVDLATGTGAVLRALAKRRRRPGAAVGIDHSPRMMSRVGRLPAGWRTMQGDARHVPLPDGETDVVICSYLLQLLARDERARVLAEARRLLRPTSGARLVVVTPWAHRGTPGGRLVHGALEGLASARPGRWGGLMPLDPTGELEAAGLVPTHRTFLPRGGYPSLVIRARPG
jgi:SAM-dependent methyltransferase